MAGLLSILIAISIWSIYKYGDVFWDAFYPNFLATVIGVVISILFAWVLWKLQQRAQKATKRHTLIQNLKDEAAINSDRINDIEVVFNDSEAKKIGKEWVITLKAVSFGTHRIRPLRTAAAKNFLKPENLVLINEPKLEDDVDWILRRVEVYNDTLFTAFNKFYNDIESDKDVEESINNLRSSISPGVRFLQGYLDGLKQRS